MPAKPKILMILAVISLGLLFFKPLWKITLTAPQYKEGISMYIWVNKITGDSEHTLQNINILNHYVGMKYIEPESIPELKYFPWIIIFMIVAGTVIAFSKNRWWYLTWSMLLLILGILGLYDFYLWEYDYGHNLSDTAPIKVPGMVYQPPLLGSKMLLNFKAESYPHWGALGLVLALMLGFSSFFLKKLTTRNVPVVMALFFLCLQSCSSSPQPIQFGIDGCAQCKMTIVDHRYGAELISDKGKVYKFDAIECMIRHSNPKKNPSYQYLVIDFDSPGSLITADIGSYLQSEQLPSPMGMNLTAFAKEKTALELQTRNGGKIYQWNSLLDNFEKLNSKFQIQP